ncbi:MAG: hypothetical protein R3301_17970 [Saprospiraceae bacterium]|nr:hypothetical protein [Saprospiraceae bacterium]
MQHQRLVIATGITNLTDARYFSAMGVDWMGFDLTREPRISRERMQAIMDWVEGPRWLVELDGTALEGLPEGIAGVVVPAGQALRDWHGQTIVSVSTGLPADADVALVDVTRDARLPAWVADAEMPVWIRAPWDEALLSKILPMAPQAGIVLSGSTEEAVGIRDYDAMDALFELLETARG